MSSFNRELVRFLLPLLLAGCGTLESIRAEVRTQNQHLVCQDETVSQCTTYRGQMAEPVQPYDQKPCCDGHGGPKYQYGYWVFR